MVNYRLSLATLGVVLGDFVFLDFNQTQGLRMNGDASPSTCRRERSLASLVGTGCIQLTTSRPNQVGSTWYHLPQPVQSGFESSFTFRITDQSQHCTQHRDLDFSLETYERCTSHGGNGLAFVVHNDLNGTAALGLGGNDLGYGGLAASIAVELDMEYSTNRGAKGDPAPVDHVELRSRGITPNTAYGADALLAPPIYHDLADGSEHIVKVKYVPWMDDAYLAYLAAYPTATRFILDGGEHRRIGLLLIFLDEGVRTDDPAIAVPLNLPEMLNLPGGGNAYFGLTAATGNRWQTHDIMSWYVCARNCAGTEAKGFRP